MNVMYFPVRFDIASTHDPKIAIKLVEIVMRILFVVSVTDNHSVAAKTGINNVASPKIGRKKKIAVIPTPSILTAQPDRRG